MPIVVSEFAHMMGGGPSATHQVVGDQIFALKPGTTRIAVRAEAEDVMLAVASDLRNADYKRLPAFECLWVNIHGPSKVGVKPAPKVTDDAPDTD